METSASPLLKALPPATDYFTYLTILEFNLTRDHLPTLHQVLQDSELTSNVGWDLVHLLLPLLPAAEQCLRDVATLGNPREVVLKVTESLRALELDDDVVGGLDHEGVPARHIAEDSEELENGSVSQEDNGKGSENGAGEEPTGREDEVIAVPQSTPAVLRFNILVSMLETVHPRIKTKYPSRFLSTSLRAVLRAYARLTWSQDATTSVLQLIKSLSGQKRPNLPPRMSSKNVQSTTSQTFVPDPEAQSDVPSAEEVKLRQRLLQSFVTHVLEDYLSDMPSIEGVTGAAWTSRLQEKAHPGKVIPGRNTYADRFAESEGLHGRDAMIGQIVVCIHLPLSVALLTAQALARDLELDSQELLHTIITPYPDSESIDQEDTVPSSPQDIPLSRVGALYLFVAGKASAKLFESPAFVPEISIFPDHALIVQNYLGRENIASIGTEPDATIDAVLCLGLAAYDEDLVGQRQSDEDFNQYLQRLSLISANTPSPSLRYHAHVLTSSVLHSHPSDLVRLTFIRDTLEHCPYENLKASAVGWLKDEILAAVNHPNERTKSPSVFATPVAIDTTAPYIFPDLSETLRQPLIPESWAVLKLNFSFYLATLNLYYLLLSSQHIREALNIVNRHKKHHVSPRFLTPLHEVAKQDLAAPQSSSLAAGDKHSDVPAGFSDMWILDDALEQVSCALQNAGLD